MLKIIILFIIVLSIIPIIALIFVLRHVRKNMQKSLGELFPKINLFSNTFENGNIWNGIQYHYRFLKGSRSRGATFLVSIPCPSAGSFRISKLLPTDRFFRRTGLSAVIKSGDAVFDDQIFVHTDHPDFARSAVSAPQFRQAISHLCDIGFNQIEIKDSQLIASIVPYRFQKRLSITQLEEVVSQLATLKQDIPTSTTQQVTVDASWKQKRVLAFALPLSVDSIGMLALALGFIYFKPVEFGSLFAQSLGYSVPLLFGVLWACTQLLKGRTNSHREWMIVSAIALGGFIVGGFGILMLTNGLLDNSDISSYDLQIVDKYKRHSGNEVQYHVNVTSWRRGETSRGFNVSRREFEKVRPGESMMHVETKDGKWGQEWYVSYGLVPTNGH